MLQGPKSIKKLQAAKATTENDQKLTFWPFTRFIRILQRNDRFVKHGTKPYLQAHHLIKKNDPHGAQGRRFRKAAKKGIKFEAPGRGHFWPNSHSRRGGVVNCHKILLPA